MMGQSLRTSVQSLWVLEALLVNPARWRHGYALTQQIGTASGTLYPILMRLERLKWLEARWEEPSAPGRPPRNLYRLTSEARVWAREELAHAKARKVGSKRIPGRESP